MTHEIWVIKDGRPAARDLSELCTGASGGEVTEYNISELAYYLLNPDPIRVEDRIIGCRVKYHAPSAGIIKRIIARYKGDKNQNDSSVEELLSSSKTGNPTFKDSGLNLHFIKINEMLRPFDPIQKKLTALDRSKIRDITAVCEEMGGNRYPLNLSGSIDEKLNFLTGSMSKKTKVIFSKSYLLNGLFEMRGAGLNAYRKDKEYRIIRFKLKDETKYCVVNKEYKLEFWINDGMLINYLFIFEQSIRTDAKLREAMALCVKGEAKPIKLFFSKQLDQKYSESRLPVIYREILDTLKIDPREKSSIAHLLNKSQSIVFFSYAPKLVRASQKLYTNISVMHDFRALEPIREQIPQIYAEIDKKVSNSDVGRLYLMDSIRESQNV